MLVPFSRRPAPPRPPSPARASIRLGWLLALATVAACQDGGGDDHRATVGRLTASQDPSGYYGGNASTAGPPVSGDGAAVLDAAGNFQLFTDADTQYSGQLTLDSGNNASGPVRAYDAQGNFLAAGTFSGTVTPQSHLRGSIALANGQTVSLSLDYGSLPQVPLSALAGSYSSQTSRNNRARASYVLKADGTFTGTTEFGCNVTGSLAAVDSTHIPNPYRATLRAASTSACGAAAGKTLGGFAVLHQGAGYPDDSTFTPFVTTDTTGILAQAFIVSPGGFYTGTFDTPTQAANKTSDPLRAQVTEGGALNLVDTATNRQYTGQLSLYGATATASLRVFDATGKYTATASLSGTLTSRNSFTGTITTASGEQDSFSLTFNTHYFMGTPLTTAAGHYSGTVPAASQNGGAASVSFTPDGAFVGSFNGGNCGFTGQVKVADDRFDLFAVTLTPANTSACGTAAGVALAGTAYYVPASSQANTPATLNLMVAGTNAALSASYSRD